MALLLCGFVGFFGAQIIKVLSPVPLRSGTKLILAALASGGCSAALFTHRPADLAVYAVAGAGLAVFTHKATRLLSLLGDWCVSEMLRKRNTPR